jgi:hypothetical protein
MRKRFDAAGAAPSFQPFPASGEMQETGLTLTDTIRSSDLGR